MRQDRLHFDLVGCQRFDDLAVRVQHDALPLGQEKRPGLHCAGRRRTLLVDVHPHPPVDDQHLDGLRGVEPDAERGPHGLDDMPARDDAERSRRVMRDIDVQLPALERDDALPLRETDHRATVRVERDRGSVRELDRRYAADGRLVGRDVEVEVRRRCGLARVRDRGYRRESRQDQGAGGGDRYPVARHPMAPAARGGGAGVGCAGKQLGQPRQRVHLVPHPRHLEQLRPVARVGAHPRPQRIGLGVIQAPVQLRDPGARLDRALFRVPALAVDVVDVAQRGRACCPSLRGPVDA